MINLKNSFDRERKFDWSLKIIVFSFLSFGLVLSSDSSNSKSSDNLACSSNSKYTVTFRSNWSAGTYPKDFPSNPHYSGLIGATHNEHVSFWKVGGVASAGIKNMSETGSKSPLKEEIRKAIKDGTAKSLLSGKGLRTSPGVVSLNFEVVPSHSKVTLSSMLAPSPDWFVGVSALELCRRGGWITDQSIDLFIYDAGTDSGNSYQSPNQNTNPREKITRSTEDIFKKSPVGTLRFVKK